MFGRFGQRFNAGGFQPLANTFRSPFGLRGVMGSSGFDLYRRRGFVGRMVDKVPAPLKAFGAIAGLAAATVLLAPALLILAGPPLVCGWWIVRRQRKMLQSVADQLHNQRWKDMASFHLQHAGPDMASFAPNQLGAQQIPVYARAAVEQAVDNNEQQIASKLRIGSAAELDFGEISLLSQDFRMGVGGLNEQMLVSEYPIYVHGQTAGLVRVASRGDPAADASRHSAKSRIEVQTRDGTIYVLRSARSSDTIIEGHGHRIS